MAAEEDIQYRNNPSGPAAATVKEYPWTDPSSWPPVDPAAFRRVARMFLDAKKEAAKAAASQAWLTGRERVPA
jgi:hypothetical protein